MHHITADQANLIVRENLKHNKKRTFNESGIHFDGDVWAFPINNKIFIGMKDYAMDEKTCLLVRRAMFRYKVVQTLKRDPAILVAAGALLCALVVSAQMCDGKRKDSRANKYSTVIDSVRNTKKYTSFASAKTR